MLRKLRLNMSDQQFDISVGAGTLLLHLEGLTSKYFYFPRMSLFLKTTIIKKKLN